MSGFELERSSAEHGEPALPRVELEIVRGHARRPRRSVTGKVYLIGSASDSDLVLADSQFPAAYAYLLVQPEGVSLRCVGGSPVLTVNGRQVQTATLCHDDLLELGAFALRVTIEPAVGVLPTAPANDARPTTTKPLPLPPVEEVLKSDEARQKVSQLLADIASTVEASPPLRLYRGPEPARYRTPVPTSYYRATA